MPRRKTSIGWDLIACGVVGASLLSTHLPAGRCDSLDEVRAVMQGFDLDLQERERALRAGLDEICSPEEMRRALAFTEWQDRGINQAVAEVDARVRAALVDRFDLTIRGLLRGKDESARLAAINLIADMGCTVRGPGDTRALARRYAPDLVECMREGNSDVRVAVVRALGRITPEPKIAVCQVEQLLQSQNHAERVAAAEACQNLMMQVWNLSSCNKNLNGVEYAQEDVAAMACALVPVARRGLIDAHPEVRCRCLDSMRTAARALDAYMGSAQDDQERMALIPWVTALQDQLQGLTHCQNDVAIGARMAALQTIDCLARAQAQLLRLDQDRRSRGVNELEQVGFSATHINELRHGMLVSLRALSTGLEDPEVRVRRFAIDAIEPLGPLASASVPRLLTALNDPDRFVRWAATRTLGRMGQSSDPEVTKGLARVLVDSDVEIRRAAAQALECQGPAAAVTVPILIRLIDTDTPDLRIAAMRVLRHTGNDASKALPSLMMVLEHDHPKVRRQAAESLGHMGSLARPAEPALRNALQDSESEVRHAAAAALVGISHCHSVVGKKSE